MNKKSNRLEQTISPYIIVNPRTIINLILPHSIESKRTTYDADKITLLFGFNRLFIIQTLPLGQLGLYIQVFICLFMCLCVSVYRTLIIEQKEI